MAHRGLSTGVLQALLGQPPASGFELCATIAAATGRRCTPSRLLPALISLEDAGLLAVDRGDDPFLYALTPAGRAAAYDAGAAEPEPALLVMADLVGFTRFTELHGDAAAHEQASRFTHCARAAVRPAAGTLVKSLGDGVLLRLPPAADPLALLRRLAGAMADAEPSWQLHAGAHVGCPIRHGGDVFGRDVNLVARLCTQAAPGQVLITTEQGAERVQVPGFDETVAVQRVAL